MCSGRAEGSVPGGYGPGVREPAGLAGVLGLNAPVPGGCGLGPV